MTKRAWTILMMDSHIDTIAFWLNEKADLELVVVLEVDAPQQEEGLAEVSWQDEVQDEVDFNSIKTYQLAFSSPLIQVMLLETHA